jgi:hypothetical protein
MTDISKDDFSCRSCIHLCQQKTDLRVIHAITSLLGLCCSFCIVFPSCQVLNNRNMQKHDTEIRVQLRVCVSHKGEAKAMLRRCNVNTVRHLTGSGLYRIMYDEHVGSIIESHGKAMQ